ncbi:LysR family transcriptional regulator [Granulicella sp. S156]|uniref:LysR family transcriptional regulator n=1 Tax=Granulicella sp. S156 TaxID=1747224 RepID=UPI00131BE63C|nr:LysR family transcriptional regulator [Granulicella sp. S156]
MRNDLGELSAFAIVAEERSFTRAAARLGISQSALSHSISGLEKRLGLQLLARTTRSVSPTSAGTALLHELAPALERIERAVAETRKQRETPSGRIRLIIPRTATKKVVLPKLAQFARNYPEIVLEVTSSNDPVDLVAGEYDAGVQLGEFIQRDMIAVRVTKEMRLAIVGSPKYFKSNSIPKHPQDLKDHACIGFRFSNGLYRWEFEKGRKALTVSPQGPASFDDPDLVIQAVLDGVGIGSAMEDSLRDLIAQGRLVQVLRDWCPSFPGYFLYYPSRRNQPAALAALIETLRVSE